MVMVTSRTLSAPTVTTGNCTGFGLSDAPITGGGGGFGAGGLGGAGGVGVGGVGVGGVGVGGLGVGGVGVGVPLVLPAVIS